MAEPGAKMSRQVPVFEKLERASVIVVEPTVMACGTLAGEKRHASALLLPAAMPYVTPDAIDRCTGESSVVEIPPPRLMFATAGLIACDVTQSTPATTPAVVPEPWQLSTRTPTSCTALASPKVRPPMVPETWVPWPAQSVALESLSTKSNPDVARPPNSVCVKLIPVSITYACTLDAVVVKLYL